ncbi:MAG TPA: response regulator transcription factor [Candidatus Limnocylindria bacterium]|nr:response regulator transcription factor [Candidatus Limnocylindria bacterium]
MPEPIRILIVDDHEVIAEGLALLTAASPDLLVVGLAHSAADGLRVAAESRPDVVLLDHHLPDRSGVQIIAELKELRPDAAVIMLTSDDSDDVLVGAFESGAAGYLLKTRAASEVIGAIRSAAAGEMLVSEGTLARVLRHQRSRAVKAAKIADALTDRELAVLRALASGLDTKRIAIDLGLTVSTVRTYVQVILRKLDAHSRLQAVMRAHERRLL